ncbi:hypothetical protein PIB30_110187 [Stylosanthes scabra]|uniref:Uncharacterized protein n=1 Tax=Stylosanthes scabra TaxID=79078 RepID=A0ABU6WZE3_9FABA|nr:hypothetical protein [Stylosanthes scabra]
MIAPANVCAQNHHKRASEGNGAAAERPRGAHLLAMEPRPSGCPPAGAELPGRGSAARRTGKKRIIISAPPRATVPPPRGLAGPISSPWSPALPDARPAGAKLPGRGSAARRTGKKRY